MPAVFLAPFNGAICNSLPKSRVLTWTAFYGFAVMAVFALLSESWITCWALISIGSAIYGPTRYAMLPAAAADTHWSLPRINGFIEMGTFSAILGGMILILGAGLHDYSVFDHWNAAIVLVLVLNGVAWLTALPVQFPSDVRRDEPPWEAVPRFFSDFRAIWNVREARNCLIGLSGKRGLVIGMSGAMLAIMFDGKGYSLKDIGIITCWVMAGVAVGSLLAGMQKHPRRVLGLVPLGAVGFTVGMGYAAMGDRPDEWFCALVGVGRRVDQRAFGRDLPSRRSGRRPWQRHGGAQPDRLRLRDDRRRRPLFAESLRRLRRADAALAHRRHCRCSAPSPPGGFSAVRSWSCRSNSSSCSCTAFAPPGRGLRIFRSRAR